MQSLKVGHYNTINEKIGYLRRVSRVRTWQYQRKFIPTHVYYDQIEEISSTISHLKRQQNDILELWCADNPDDIECRTYDV